MERTRFEEETCGMVEAYAGAAAGCYGQAVPGHGEGYVEVICALHVPLPLLSTILTNNEQTNQRITISTSTLCMPCLKPAVPKPQAKPLGWKT